MSSTSASTSHTVLPVVKTGATRDGRKAYLKALRKFGISTTHYHTHEGKVYIRNKPHAANSQLELHPFVHSHVVQKRATAPSSHDVTEVPAQDIEHGSEYVVSVEIGTPPVKLLMDFDTGSSDLWVKGPEHSRVTYDPTKSTTAKPLSGAQWNIGYGDGSYASGGVYTDVLRIGDLTVQDQAIQVAETCSQDLQRDKISGLFGLAWPSINTVTPDSVLTPVANMIGQGRPGIFSCALDYGDNDSFYTFGGIDAAKAGVKEEDIVYVPCVSPPQYWTITSNRVIVNGKNLPTRSGVAILDTGTTLCLLADRTVAEIYKQIPGAKQAESDGLWLIPSRSKIPKVRIDIGGHDFELNPKSFAYQKDIEDGYDLGCVQSRGNIPLSILGDAVLNALYVIFDQDQNRVGIAQRTKLFKEVEDSKQSLLDRILPWKSSSKVNLSE